MRNSTIVGSMQAVKPRSLELRVERVIQESGCESVADLKNLLSNQLKSGDLSIKTTDSRALERLSRFADEWTPQLGGGAIVDVRTYGVIVHGTRIRSVSSD